MRSPPRVGLSRQPTHEGPESSSGDGIGASSEETNREMKQQDVERSDRKSRPLTEHEKRRIHLKKFHKHTINGSLKAASGLAVPVPLIHCSCGGWVLIRLCSKGVKDNLFVNNFKTSHQCFLLLFEKTLDSSATSAKNAAVAPSSGDASTGGAESLMRQTCFTHTHTYTQVPPPTVTHSRFLFPAGS